MESSVAHRFDTVVIGAGAGGLCAAALLARHGRRVLLVESRDRVGGRASSVDDEGFTVNTGAVAIEDGGPREAVFDTVGAPFEIRIPQPASTFRLKGRTVDLSKGGWGMLFNGITKRVPACSTASAAPARANCPTRR
jgi:phytoene desaturase